MKCLNRITALVCALLLIIPTTALRAGEDEPFIEGVSISSGLVVLISIYFVVSIPLAASEASSDRYYESKAARRKAKANIPDMEVKEVGETENGEPQVRLQDPNNPENYAVLMWPTRKNNPTSVFQEGALIRFQPSDQGSGWLLRDNTGIALAFIPLIDNRVENHRTLF